MMQPTLSILIPTITDRAPLLRQLLSVLLSQVERADGQIEMLIDSDNGDVSIGEKRQRLLERSSGSYVCYIDDDDNVAPDYAETILEALQAEPDAVGFFMRRSIYGIPVGVSEHSKKYTGWKSTEREGKPFYERTITHINPVRRELALKAGFPAINWAEDLEYSMRLAPLIKTEVFVDRVLYEYAYVPRRDRREKTHRGDTPK